MNISEFDVTTDAGPLTCGLTSPAPENTATDPALLLAFGGARQGPLGADAHSDPAELFVQAGHRALRRRKYIKVACGGANQYDIVHEDLRCSLSKACYGFTVLG